METAPDPQRGSSPFNLGVDGEAGFDRLRACLEIGRGFEVFFCGFDAPNVLEEVRRRLAETPPASGGFEAVTLDGPGGPTTLPERLAGVSPSEGGRKVVFVAAPGSDEDLKGMWALALRRLNERRNATMRGCPNAVVLAGPSWLPWLAHDAAPDLWSVRTAIFDFPSPPFEPGTAPALKVTTWPSGLPMAHELQPPEYYEDLALALEGSRRPGEQGTRGRLLLRASAAWHLRGDNDRALATIAEATRAFASAGEEAMIAVSREYVADILQQRGETDEALRILREEALPIYELLGDVRERAMTMGQIADILQQRGETDEVLRIRREEELPVYERLGDVRSRAVTLGQIANILQQRGETGEALRILREEALPVFERLGDVRSRAVTLGQIADILQQRGETDEALRIQLEERLPVALKLHDLDLLAHIRFSCAMIRLARGGMEKGEEQLIFDEMAESFALINQLGRVDGVTVVGRIYGPLLTKTGQIETALDVLEKTAKAFERLNMGEQAANLRGMAKKKP